MFEFFSEVGLPYETYLGNYILDNSRYWLNHGPNGPRSKSNVSGLLKLDKVGNEVERGTNMLSVIRSETTSSQRTLTATDKEIRLMHHLDDGTVRSVIWSQPLLTPEGRKRFTRCEASVTFPQTDYTNGGTMNMFYDEPQKGTERYQLLVTLNGELYRGQTYLLDNVVFGATYSPDGKRLIPGTYSLG